MWRDASTPDPDFTDTLELDINSVTPSIAGPKRPQDRIELTSSASAFTQTLIDIGGVKKPRSIEIEDFNQPLSDGDVVIAAITSCTNTSNPSVLIAAGLLARNAVAKGLKSKPWVKTSLAPGSKVAADYLEKANLRDDLDKLGFAIAAFGCTSCIGNSGPLPDPIAKGIDDGDLVAAAVLSGNRNFEGRINPWVKANYLASPPLVVAYALAGSMTFDLYNDPLGKDLDGKHVYLKDIWPSNKDVAKTVDLCVERAMFENRYGNVYEGPNEWKAISSGGNQLFNWPDSSTYIKYPPYFENMEPEPSDPEDILGARPLLILGDSVTTDHISPAGAIPKDGPAGDYLLGYQIRPEDFNSFGSRRGNHEVMMRGTFANIRIRNEMVPNKEGGYSIHYPTNEEDSVYKVAMRYKDEGVPLVAIGGKLYGSGSSRDWAAKGSALLGIKAVIVESFERIHRSNLIGMGIMPLVFKNGQDRKLLNLDGTEIWDLTGMADGITPSMDVNACFTRSNGNKESITLLSRIETLDEVDYYLHGGILQYVLRRMLAETT